MASIVFERTHPDPRIVQSSLANSRLSPFWLEGLGSPAFPRFAGTAHYDLVVVGGGYTGLWTALQAKQRDPDARVAVVEARTIGWAASGRNGGFCESTLTHGEVNGEMRFPNELAQLDRLGVENLDEIEALVASERWDCDFERSGSLAVATEEYQVEELRAAQDGDAEVFLDESAIRNELNSPTYLAGL
ncbi:MAG: putative oxidoreductase, partial [Glaciihabitans sp.]|nr:putative oxidoreductase [Glaciihabitans sp.]